MTPKSIRTWCDEAAKASTPNEIASRLNDALWRLRTAADAIGRKDVALKVALNGKITQAAEDIITAALSDHHPTAF